MDDSLYTQAECQKHHVCQWHIHASQKGMHTLQNKKRYFIDQFIFPLPQYIPIVIIQTHFFYIPINGGKKLYPDNF